MIAALFLGGESGFLEYNMFMVNKTIGLMGIVAFLIVVLFLNFTTPNLVGPLGVLVFFTSLFAMFYSLIWTISVFLKVLAVRGKRAEMTDYLLVAIWAFVPILLMLIHSFGVNIWLSMVAVIIFVLAARLLIKRWG